MLQRLQYSDSSSDPPNILKQHVVLFSFLSDDQNVSKSSSICKPPHPIENLAPLSRWPTCLLVIQGLFTSFLALSNSLVMLLITPQHLHSTGACSLLVYLDPGLSLLAVIMLLATAKPQVRLSV